MDDLARTAIHRAQDALNIAVGDDDNRLRKNAFVEICRGLALSRNFENRGVQFADAMAQSNNPFVQKSGAAALGDWGTVPLQSLAQAFVASIAPGSILDSLIAAGAVQVPPTVKTTFVATGDTSAAVSEGGLKVVKKLAFTFGSADPHKVASIIALTDRVLLEGGDQALQILETELGSSVTRATNALVLSLLNSSASAGVTQTTDALADLRAAIRAAQASRGFVYCAPPGIVSDLSTRQENRAATPQGGQFSPGVFLVPIEGATSCTLIPASKVAIADLGLSVSPPSKEATVNMADSPASPSTVVSLWQTGTVGILAERQFHLAVDSAETVLVSPGS